MYARSSHDIGSCLAPLSTGSNSIFLQAYSEQYPYGPQSLFEMIVDNSSNKLLQKLRNDPDLKEHDELRARIATPCYIPHKDIVIPPFSGIFTGFKEVRRYLEQQKRRQFSNMNTGRVYFAYFRGSIFSDRRYSNGVRQYLHGIADPRYHIYDTHVSKFQYISELGNSLFCLCPQGWETWSPRLYQGMYAHFHRT